MDNIMPKVKYRGKRIDGEMMYISLIIIALLIIVGVVLKPYIEMKTFNKFSEKKATYIEAMFSNLRVNAR